MFITNVHGPGSKNLGLNKLEILLGDLIHDSDRGKISTLLTPLSFYSLNTSRVSFAVSRSKSGSTRPGSGTRICDEKQLRELVSRDITGFKTTM